MISGVIVGAVFQLISSQGRFVEMQSAREEVQQNSRAAIELIGSELRTIPGGEALVRADEDSLTIRTPRFWGVVCAVTGATTLDVAFPAIAGASWSINNGTGLVVDVGTATPAWTTAVGVSAIGNAGTNCNGEALTAGTERRSLTLTAAPMNGTTGPAIGNNLYIYDQVTYRTGSGGSVPGVWIQRRLGDGVSSTNQPMAGPVDANNGLRFDYFAAASTIPLPTPITVAATRASVSRIQMVVNAISRNDAGYAQEETADTVVISLRNRL